MNNSAAKVGEIFREAGTAFNKLSEMTLMLQPMDDSPPGGKWSDAEVEMLRGCINRFAVELNKISQHIKNRTMRLEKYLLEMGSGTIQDISGLLPQQPQQPLLFPQLPQPSPQQQHPAQRINTLETESQFDLNGVLVNIFSQGFPDNDDKDEDFDSFLLHLDPSEVNSTPADVMQEDSIQQQPSSEFEDLQDSSLDKTLQAVPSLISLLDADVNNATPHSESINSTESCMANIGTLHAELPNYVRNLDEATGASSNFQELNYIYTGLVSRVAHFSLRQAQDTWNHVSSPATSHINPIESEETLTGNFILYTPFNCPKSPYSNESAFTEKIWLTESQYRPQLDTVSSLLAGSEEALTYIQSQGNPLGEILCPGTNSLNNDPFGSVQARYDEQERSSTNQIIFNNLFGNSLYNANPEPVTSVQAQTNFSLIRADTNEQALAPRANRTRGSRVRRRPRRRRQGPATPAPADSVISPPDESTAEPSQGRITRSRRRQACHCEEIEDPVKKKGSRKKAPTKIASCPRTRARKNKQSPT